ncbi:MAG: hypothetical protein AB7F35_16900 [Acetobacteraceae bacterium]
MLFSPSVSPKDLDAFVAVAGETAWMTRLAEIRDLAARGPRAGMAIRQRHAVELVIERLRRPLRRTPSAAEHRLGQLAAGAAALARLSGGKLRGGLERALSKALTGEATLIPLFHQMRTAAMHEARGFTVRFAGLEEDAPYDLLLRRDRVEAEVACDVISAEEGRGVHRGVWFRLADRIDPDLQTWLAAHPGRYLLKMTLPLGLRGRLTGPEDDVDTLASLHARIRALLASRTRQDHDEAIVLRLDPLLLAGAQADELGLMSSLRQEFGPEAHLAVTTAANGVFAIAARAGMENGIATAIRHRMTRIAPERLSGERAGILAMFVEDADRTEWRQLREHPDLEAESRQFLMDPRARSVLAVTLSSRFQLFGLEQPDDLGEGEIRFRNPGHPAARAAALAPAVVS